MFGFRLPSGVALALLLAACSDANAPKIYVASTLTHTIKAYNAAGVQTTPTITLPQDLETMVVDASGKLYVAESDGPKSTDTITTYSAAGAPTSPTITGLRCVSAIAVDGGGKIYVANECDGTVTAYTPAGVRTVPTITGLGSPQAIALGAAGKIYVHNFDNNTLTTYTSAGVQTTPSVDWLSDLFAVDASGKIYAEATDGSLETYKADGTQTPTIALPKNSGVFDVAIDGAGKIYVLSSTPAGNGSILRTYNTDGTPSSPTITGLPGTLTVKLDHSTSGTSGPMITVR
jgi:hypothetical protein